jgi:diadenosine tetraphosphate (Ap4A) HIT family hydrolase
MSRRFRREHATSDTAVSTESESYKTSLTTIRSGVSWAALDAGVVRRHTGVMSNYPRVPFDVEGYVERVRSAASSGSCFICSIVAGTRDDHLVIFRDDVCIAFLAKDPTLFGCSLLAPIEHRTGVVADFSEDEYVELQRRVHRLGRAVSEAVPTERLYVLALGSHEGTAHVHWHVAPLPPGVPYRQQQYAALMHENGYLDIPADEQAALASRLENFMEAEEG